MKGIRRIERMLFGLFIRRSRTSVERHGSDYGGWLIPSALLDEESVVYSGGVGEDVTFDQSVIRAFGCSVFAFDPTPRAVAFAKRVDEPEFHFFPVGLWSEDSVQEFRAPRNPDHVSHSIGAIEDATGGFRAACRSIPSLMREFGHDRITVLKLDIEGSEYDVLPAMLADGVTPEVVCVELHGGLCSALWLVRRLRRAGYRPIALDSWDLTLAFG